MDLTRLCSCGGVGGNMKAFFQKIFQRLKTPILVLCGLAALGIALFVAKNIYYLVDPNGHNWRLANYDLVGEVDGHPGGRVNAYGANQSGQQTAAALVGKVAVRLKNVRGDVPKAFKKKREFDNPTAFQRLFPGYELPPIMIVNCDATGCSQLRPGEWVKLNCFEEEDWRFWFIVTGPSEQECRYLMNVNPPKDLSIATPLAPVSPVANTPVPTSTTGL